jgi:hypothetical protein
MKTFKLISLEIVEDEKNVEVPLDHGVIINKENSKATWLIEAYTKLGLYDYFKKIQDEDRELIVEVIITKAENDPVYYQTKISCLQLFEEHISVLLEGKLRRKSSGFSEILLERLIKDGLTGEDLLSAFKKQKNSKPKLKPYEQL